MSRTDDGADPAGDQAARIAALEDLVAGLTRELRDRDERAEHEAQSQRLESLGRLAVGVAHDLGNLMAAIRGYAGIALTTLPDDHPAAGDAREIEKAADRAATLLRQLLAFGRRSPVAPRPLDLGEVVLGLEPILSRLLGEAVELRVEQPLAPCVVVADRSQMEQVLVNLAVNARDAMPRGGVVTVGVAPAIGTEGRPLAAEIDGASVRLTVSDTGSGIAPDVLPKIFEPFFTTRATGRGLGLAVVHGIVSQAGGAIDVRSRPGEGAVFDVYLPEASATPVVAAQELAGGAELVLIVENEPGIRTFVERILASHGYRVLTAAGAHDAAEAAKAAPVPIDLVVTDGMLAAEGTGQEAVRRVRESHPAARAVLMSVDPPTSESENAPAWLRKPFTRGELLLAVRSALDRESRQDADHVAVIEETQ